MGDPQINVSSASDGTSKKWGELSNEQYAFLSGSWSYMLSFTYDVSSSNTDKVS